MTPSDPSFIIQRSLRGLAWSFGSSLTMPGLTHHPAKDFLVTWPNFISVPSDLERFGGTLLLFISFHPRSSIQYNMCYERKYCTIDQSEFKVKFTNCSAADLLSSTVPFASAACNPTLRFLYKLFYNFWHIHSQCHQHKGTPIISIKFLGN